MAYVDLNKKGSEILGLLKEAKAAKDTLDTKMSIYFSGEDGTLPSVSDRKPNTLYIKILGKTEDTGGTSTIVASTNMGLRVEE